MNTLLERIGAYIEDSGLATQGTDLFLDELPGTPVACTAVILTGGPYDRSQFVRWKTFQILVRNPVAYTARTLINSLHPLFNNVFADRDNCILPGFEGRLYPQHELGPHFLDENDHTIYTMNYVLETIQN